MYIIYVILLSCECIVCCEWTCDYHYASMQVYTSHRAGKKTSNINKNLEENLDIWSLHWRWKDLFSYIPIAYILLAQGDALILWTKMNFCWLCSLEEQVGDVTVTVGIVTLSIRTSYPNFIPILNECKYFLQNNLMSKIGAYAVQNVLIEGMLYLELCTLCRVPHPCTSCLVPHAFTLMLWTSYLNLVLVPHALYLVTLTWYLVSHALNLMPWTSCLIPHALYLMPHL